MKARLFAMGDAYHKACFRCACCQAEIGERRFVPHDGEPYLEGCYQKLFGTLSGTMQSLIQASAQKRMHIHTNACTAHTCMHMHAYTHTHAYT